MSMKKKFGMGMMSVALGAALIGGGTYAYFSDTETSQNTFAAGTLDLSLSPTEIINVKDMAPGDSFLRDFELGNGGTLDIDKVLLETDYTVKDAKGDNTGDFGEHIQVEFLYNMDNFDEVIFETTLADLKNMTPEAISQNIFYPELGDKGLPVGKTHDLIVQFSFMDKGDQNQFQGDSLELTWKFNATQKPGEQK
ncbi:cell division protein FtsN [Siminovitchia acidinfaciens]|uniref:Cell division protein FtsN n=1 Tax=Siminovitchia acidinfaciens TaxID=2321395 RepID=A0A429XWH5_9BACI|nr:CalY family protein [Siminovitchia acidinfaciens]RST72737.1 cell division protein FtsN [Siminovitchia acidinfaciens]